MTLEDFFTLTEMNNGLTAPSRVRELMAAMQRDRDSIVKNSADSTRQWSAVASAIAATENKDCLDLFIQLDGLHFISGWLKDAKKLNDDKIDSFVEESIAHLLQALEKLHVDYEKLVASEIWTTVQDLLVHNNSKVQDKAQVLFESWKTKRDSDASLSDVEKTRVFTDDEAGKGADTEKGMGHLESSVGDASISTETSVKEKGHELSRDDSVLSISSDTVHPSQVESAQNSEKILDTPSADERSLDHVGSPSVPEPTVEPPLSHSISTTFEPCSPAVSRQNSLGNRSEFHGTESPSYRKQSPKIESLPEKLGSLEESKTSESRPFTCAVDEMKPVTELSSQKNSIAGEKNSCVEGLSYVDTMISDSDGKAARDDGSDANQCKSSSAFIVKEGNEFNHRKVSKSSSSEKSWGNPKGLGTFLSGIQDSGKVNSLRRQLSDNGLAKNYNFGKKQLEGEPDRAGKKSNVEIDYGIVDPLEFARQVAIEVEREVGDYREQSCSSSEKLPEGNGQQPNSPDSVTGKQSHASEGSLKADDPNLSDESSPVQEESATSSGNLDPEQTNGTQDMATSQVIEAAQEEVNTEKGLCNFDLNLEVCLEDADRPGNQFSTPVSVVSASRAVAAPGQPGAPLQFEGNLGWKGSAATSAFRPASPRRMPENDKDPSTGGSSSSSKQREGCLDFDLNVAVDTRAGDMSLDKHVLVYSSLPSGESSVETNSRRSEHLELDLNRTSEDGGAPSDWHIGQFFPQGNCRHDSSHSSSSAKQPTRNIDLNDQPSFLNEFPDKSYLSKVSQNFSISGGIKSEDSVISIMGKRVEVNRKDIVSQTSPVPNGQTELSFDVNLGRTGTLGIGSVLPYVHSSVYGYNNIAPGSAMPFSSTMYGSGGPIPYMVDSRGVPVIPQIMGSASALPTAFSQPPFVINMNNSTPSNGVGPSRSSFDLNSGMLVESGSKDPSGFGLFLSSAQARSMDEQLRSNAQSTINSIVGGKRKEPENGWEHYPFKHYTTPWKQS